MSEARSEGAHRRAHSHRTGSHRLRWILIGSGIALLVIVVLGGWLYHQASEARAELSVVRDEVHKLRTEINNGDLAAARSTAADLAHHTKQARSETSGPLWAVAANIPYAGQPLDDERTLTRAVDDIARNALPSLIDASNSLDPKTLRLPDGTINLPPLVAIAPKLSTAAAQMTKSLHQIRALPSSSWLSAADQARRDAIDQLTPLTATITSANIAAATVPTMLGQYGPQNYIVTFENEAELRGGGGLPGAFAIMKADHGKLSFTAFEPDSTLVSVHSGLDLGDVFAQTYATPDAPNDYRDANVSPHFPYAAQIWIAEWKVKTGQTLNGAMSLDPTALSYLLAVTGPATMPDGSKITADDVVSRTERDAYNLFTQAQNEQRKQYLLDIARSVSTELIGTRGDLTALVKAAGKAAAERRLLVWTADPKIESQLAPSSISGVVPDSKDPYAAVAINNSAANKLDYYAHASVSWVGQGCGSKRTVTVTITLHNGAPANLSKNALGFTGQPGFPQSPGDNTSEVTYLGTVGGYLTSVSVDGKASTASSGLDQGHPTYTVNLAIARGATSTVVLHLAEPGSGTPTLRLQPMVNPMTGTAVAHC